MFFQIFILGHIELLTKVTTRILKVLSGGDAVEAPDYVDHETDDSRDGEDVAVESDADPREGIVSDWDLLTEDFIVQAEELGKFGHSLLHTS